MWRLTSIRLNAPGSFYRYHVEGLNHFMDPPRFFAWAVPNLDNPEYTATDPDTAAALASARAWRD